MGSWSLCTNISPVITIDPFKKRVYGSTNNLYAVKIVHSEQNSGSGYFCAFVLSYVCMWENRRQIGTGAWPRALVVGVAALLLATILAWGVALAAPSRTVVQVTITADGAVARVNDDRLTLK